MLPNKGQSPIKSGESYEPLWSPMAIEPMSKEAHQKRMGISDEQEKDDLQSGEVSHVSDSLKIEYKNQYVDW